ncbi:hypothetical protein HF086_015492 [Spodoptera exigua]|uniref:DNA 5'-3' helicase n=1 Tax=Spodoptera exigua TaxID=7107 RepID=A0A922SEN0_SPOEX|nr:hypothetical protein HF086_015492 [Spodoptera exigua]
MEITFPFPFKPYDIQEKFMRELYITLEQQKLGIFESPTGTGKSLSICCGVLKWLRDSNQKILEDLEKEVAQLKAEISNSAASDDWLTEEYEKIKKNQNLISLQLKLDKIKKQKELFEQMKVRVAKQKTNSANKTIEFYFNKKDKNEKVIEDKENVIEAKEESEEDRDLILEEIEEKEDGDSDAEEVTEEDREQMTKIYISSRTHSQLSQFIGEIKRTVFKEDTRVVTLASRQHYCINSEVTKLKNVNLINERCLDMQKSKSKSTSVGEEGKVLKKTKTKACTACPYYNQTNITRLKERMLVEIMDMEDLVKSGKELKACPYYASRMAMEDAEMVLISHAGIVSSGARSGISLKLDDNILILDEAHGLTAALENAHSAPVSMKQLSSVKTFLQFYINKYRARKQDETTIFTLEDFVIKAEIDHMNLRPLVEFCRNTRLAPKLHGFSMRYSQQALEEEMKKSTVSKKSSFEMFMKNISKKKNEKVAGVEPEVKENVGVQANVIVAGGTMEPISEFQALLTSNKNDTDSLNIVRCEHVVPPQNVLGVCLSKGPTNVSLNFSYENRMSNELLSEVGRILRNICSIVPGGVVCFLPSYSYEQTVYEHLKTNKVIEAITKKKAIFREPKSASDVDQVLSKFALAVKNKDGDHNGSLLLSVVGGKLSEGLNFSDDLGRCVMVVGMPYPNVKSPELQEKMNYLNKTAGGSAGNIYYENLCMKAVNQCIGRAVRHANDYSCVLLVDERYSRPQTMSALPSFVQKSLISNCNFGTTISNIARFFARHKEK